MGNVFARIYDPVMRPLEWLFLSSIRKETAGKAKGRVLEIGSGTGLNFPYYYQAEQIDAIEPNKMMADRSQKRKHAALVPIRLHQTSAECLPFPDNTFDSAVAALVFCTIPNPEQALREIERVCKPGAVILLVEHVRMEQTLAGKTQDICTPFWMKLCDGCHLNRDTLALLQRGNVTVTHVKHYYKGLLFAAEAQNGR